MTLKKWLLILVPLALLGALVAWRFSQKGAQDKELASQAGQRQGGPPNVEVAIAEPRKIVESLQAVGTLESPFRVEISPKTSGRIEYLQVRAGDVVRPGQVLVRIDPSELQAQVAQQQASVAEARSRLAQAQLNQGPTEVGVRSQMQQQKATLASAEADLNQVQRNYESTVAAADAAVADVQARLSSARSGVTNAQAEVDRQLASLANAETKLNRIQGLYNQGFLAAQELDDAKTAVEVQRKSVEVARGQLAAANSAVDSVKSQVEASKNQASIVRRKGQADIESAKSRVSSAKAGVNVASANQAQNPAYKQNLSALESSVRAAQAQLGQAQARLKETTLTSTIEGVVTQRNADPGAMASPGQPVLVVQHLGWLYLSATLPVEQSGSVMPGQQVQVKFDALPNQVFLGPITNVNPAADVASRKVSFLVKINNPGQQLKPGMFAKVSIPTREVQAPVTIPREAVKVDSEGKATVTVVAAEDTAEVREVQLGASDEKFSQITSGVEPGDKVVTLTYRPVRDGQKVKIGKPEERKPGGPGQGGPGGGGPGAGGGRRPQ
ncbi:MAG TPA: efflux RND transporter periplasmic adaptor subunit [Fimbriimonas sp.]|nr:efflux RND transporter periplasmic adaptor subunit [Fimbriimonas sp.]